MRVNVALLLVVLVVVLLDVASAATLGTQTMSGSTYSDVGCSADGASFSADAVITDDNGGTTYRECVAVGDRFVRTFCAPANFRGERKPEQSEVNFYSNAECTDRIGGRYSADTNSCTAINVTPPFYVKVTGCTSSASQVSVSAVLLSALAFFAVRINKML